MINVALYLDTRRTKEDGNYPIKVRIHTTMISTGLSAKIDEWNGNGVNRKAANSISKNAILNKWLTDIDKKQMSVENEGGRMTAKELIEFAKEIIKGVKPREKTFLDYLDEYAAQNRLSTATKVIYNTTRNKIIAFDEKVRLDQIDKKWLQSFENWMAETMKVNAYAIHLRNIRTVFNYCIDEEYTTSYPFRKFQIRKEETEKRCLTLQQVRRLRDYHVEKYQEIYRDMWMLMFYLIGINAADLFMAKKEQVQNDRLVYKRAKTGTLYSIKIQPEAQLIINRYKGKGEYLLNIMDTYGTYKDFLHRMNWNLQRIGQVERKGRGGKKIIEAAFPDVSSYWSRHTWATIAAELDVPIEVISHALGHKIGSDVTAIYVKFNRMKVDEANRKVIDYVNGIL